LALPVDGLGILGTAAMWGIGAAGTQAVSEAATAPYREAVQPGYDASGQAGRNIMEAGIGGALTGGALRALGNVVTRAFTGEWPTAEKDAAHGIMSEAQIIGSNVLPGVEGEAAHNAALGQAIGQVLREHPVDVSHEINPPLADIIHGIGEPTKSPVEGMAPEEIAAGLQPRAPEPAGRPPPLMTAEEINQHLAGPEHPDAMRADIERSIDLAAQSGKELMVPIEVDAKGEPVWGKVASMLSDVDRMSDLARQIAACALPGAAAGE